MALFLINEAESGSLTLKYGLGNRLMMQLAAGEQKKLPKEFSTKLLQSYLAVFKDLRVIEEGKAEKVEEQLENNELGVNDESKSDDNANSNDEDQSESENGENESAGQDDNAGDDTKDDESSNESEVDESDKDDESDGADESSKPQLKPENEIKKMNAEELKKYAKELGLDFEEDITKKALLAVILSKQDEE